MTVIPGRPSAIEIAETCHKIPSLSTYRVRCGRPGCRCARGDRHGPYWFLRWRDERGANRRRYVRARDLDEIRAVLDARQSMRSQAKCEAHEAQAWLHETHRLLRQLWGEMKTDS
jgi:hypothetical protein